MRGTRPIAVTLLAAFVLLAVSPPILAGSEPPTFLGTAYNTQRKLARGADGTLYAAVTVNASNTPQVRVLASRDGVGWTALAPPSTTDLGTDRTALAVDSRGRLHLVWTELDVDAGQVFHASFASGAWTTPEQLSHSPGYAGFPSIAVDAQDRVHVAWYGFDGAFYQIYYRRLEGGAWTSERALTNEAVDATNPAIALGPQGEVHIAWFRLNRNGTLTEVAYLRLEGDTLAEILTISEAVDSVDPSIAADASGRVHVAWGALEGGNLIVVHRERAPAGPWSPIETVSPPGPGAEHPSLAIVGSGLRLVWEGTDSQIYYQRRDGGAWSSPRALTGGGTNRYPSARWAQFHEACADQLDVVWTHEEGGVATFVYASPDASRSCFPGPGLDAAVLPLAALIAGAILLGVFLWWRRRKRRAKTIVRLGARRP